MPHPKKAVRESLCVMIVLALFLMAGVPAQGQPKVGLLIVAHGAPSEKWNKLPREFAAQVQQRLEAGEAQMVAALGMLEFTKPSVADAVAELESKGINQIVVIPLFIAPSTHSVHDLPCVLGTFYDPETMATLREEGAALVRSSSSIIVTPPLAAGEVIPTIMLQRAQALSKNPKREAVVLLAHGDPMFDPQWKSLLDRVASKLQKEGGFGSVHSACIGMGHGMATHGAEVLKQAAQDGKRVLVLGVYVGLGARGLLAHAKKHLPQGLEVVGSDHGVLPHPAAVDWAVKMAHEAAAARFGTPVVKAAE